MELCCLVTASRCLRRAIRANRSHPRYPVLPRSAAVGRRFPNHAPVFIGNLGFEYIAFREPGRRLRDRSVSVAVPIQMLDGSARAEQVNVVSHAATIASVWSRCKGIAGQVVCELCLRVPRRTLPLPDTPRPRYAPLGLRFMAD
jgi:hypothetical protein